MAIQTLVHKFHNFKSNVIMLNGFRLYGFGDEDGVTYSPDADIHSKTTSIDGQPLYSKQNNFDLQATITVHAKSKAHKRLWALLKAQNLAADNVDLVPYVWKHKDPTSGDLITCPQAIFMEYPEISKSRDLEMYEYTIDLPSALLTTALGVKN